MPTAAALRIAPNVWRIPAARFDFVNIYALVDDDGQVTLVDTGFRSGASLAIESAVELARCLRDIDEPVAAFAAYEKLRRERLRTRPN